VTPEFLDVTRHGSYTVLVGMFVLCCLYALVVVVVSMLFINLPGCIRFDLSFLLGTLTTMQLSRLMAV